MREKIRRSFTLTIPEELWVAFKSFMEREQFTSEPQAASALVRMALSAAPNDALVSAARVAAYNETLMWCRSQMGNALTLMAAMLDEFNKKEGSR